MIQDVNNELILAARLLLAALFLIFGWRKLRDFSGTVSQMAQLGVPTPVLAAAAATFMELPVAFAVAVGAFTRLSAVLMFFYTLGTALVGHRYWTMAPAVRVDSMDGFYKNLSIMGGFLLLYITGPGKYSIDALRGLAGPKGTSLTASSVIRGNCLGIVRRPPEPLISDPTISAIRLRSTENILAAQRGEPTDAQSFCNSGANSA